MNPSTPPPTETLVPEPAFEATTYRDDEAGFEFDNPVGWAFDPGEQHSRGYYVQFYSWDWRPGDQFDSTIGNLRGKNPDFGVCACVRTRTPQNPGIFTANPREPNLPHEKPSIISDKIYQVLSTSEYERNQRGETKMDESQETNKENHNQSSNLWLGLIFVFGGIVIMLNQMDLLPFELNWWALFIMLPAGGFLSGAYKRYRENNDLFSMDVAFTALIGFFLTALSFSLLVGDAWDINWSLLWPLILIIIGLGMIFGRSQTE